MKKVFSYIGVAILSCTFLCIVAVCATPEKEFVIVAASYNNKDWYKRNLDSIFKQQYGN